MTNELIINSSQFLFYASENGNTKVQVFVKDETVWATQANIAEIFGVQRPAITKHLKNIYESGELDEISTSSILEHMGQTGQTYQIKYYNLCWLSTVTE